jgi:glycosyltransferase involved in cell wall biosynthesis
VSVVIPVRDGEKFLAATLQAALDQSLPPDEVIVVDDGSVDASAQVAEGFGSPVRCLRRAESGGPGVARNDGIAAAAGDAVALLDADDLPHPRWLELLRAALDEAPAADLAFGHVRLFESDAGPGGAGPLHRGLIPNGLMLRRSAFERFGAFATQYVLGEFMEWLFRARAAGLRERGIDDLVLHRRVHGGNLTLRARDSYRDYATVLKRELDRRRARG